jgi:hypothetical protein
MLIVRIGGMLLEGPSQEGQNLAPKMDVKVVPQQMSSDMMYANIGELCSALAISIPRYVSLGCTLGSVLSNVSVLKKYQ